MLKDPSLLPLDIEPTEIIEAMDVIVSNSESTGFSDNMLFFLQNAATSQSIITATIASLSRACVPARHP